MMLPILFLVSFLAFPPFSAQKNHQDAQRGVFRASSTLHCDAVNGPFRSKVRLNTEETKNSVHHQYAVVHQTNEGFTLPLNHTSSFFIGCDGENTCERGVQTECDDPNASRKDKTTRYDMQYIVALEDDPVVLQAAFSLFDKHPTISSLFHLLNGTLYLLRGSELRLTACSRVVLVGHGRRDDQGHTSLAGYRPEEIAELVVGTMKTEKGEIRTLSLVGCELARDLWFVERLLKELRALGLETKLHLRRAALSVGPQGEKMTKDNDSEDRAWRHKDSSVKIVAQLDRAGNLLSRMAGRKRGRVVQGYEGHVLMNKGRDNRQMGDLREWPNRSQRFMPSEYTNERSLKILEALAWAIFSEEDNDNERISFTDLNNIMWKTSEKVLFENNNQIIKITTIKDVVREVRYHAKQNIENLYKNVFYKLNHFIFRVNTNNMYVFLAGKVLTNNDKRGDIQKYLDSYTKEAYAELLPEIKSFDFFCMATFGQDPGHISRNAEQGHYFMAAVFAESVRNFHQFPIFLLDFTACRLSNKNNQLCIFAHKENPMARGGTWPDKTKRGFYYLFDSEKGKEVIALEIKFGNTLIHYLEQSHKNDWFKIIDEINKDYTIGAPNVIHYSLFEQYKKDFNIE